MTDSGGIDMYIDVPNSTASYSVLNVSRISRLKAIGQLSSGPVVGTMDAEIKPPPPLPDGSPGLSKVPSFLAWSRSDDHS